MDSVYGTKKYFQSLSGENNIYRGASCRALANNFSYNNTLGRQSPLGPYMHINKQPAYSTDISLNSQYGYNTWGAVNDIRNITPTLYNSKQRHKFRSFSIILTTAAVIILLAVLSIGALAFYFSGFKPNNEVSVIMFEGFFGVQRGDTFSAALKNNQSTIFRQKVDFYRRFIERSLSDNGLLLNKLDVRDFGDGPLIDVHFLMLLDVQNIPPNIHSIEDHIRNSLFLETNSVKSLYKFLKLEPDSVRISRITGERANQYMPSLQSEEQTLQQTHLERKLARTPPKHAATSRPKWQKTFSEPDVDVMNAPVIQGSFEGSFEITKTDADITAKKTLPTKSFTPHLRQSTTNIPPKAKKTMPEKTTTEMAPSTTQSIIPETPTFLKPSTTSTQSTEIQFTTFESLPANSSTKTTDSSPTTEDPKTDEKSNVSIPPRLDLTLFTSAPILDTKPWHPIQPSKMNYNIHRSADQTAIKSNSAPLSYIEMGDLDTLPGNKVDISTLATDAPNKVIYYQSFTNPVFMAGTTDIERLGNSDVKPYPIPVPLIDDVVAPDFSPVLPMHKNTNNISHSQHAENREEHAAIDAQVELVSRNDYPEDATTNLPEFESQRPEQLETTSNSLVGDVLLDLLHIPDNKPNVSEEAEKKISASATVKPLFLNIKDIVLSKTKLHESSSETSKYLLRNNNATTTGLIDDAMLYPTHTKGEYNKLGVTNGPNHQTNFRKKYNDTLQALIIENQGVVNTSLNQAKIRRNSSEDIENITLIFDTLASKLGITPNFPTKEPPFSASSYHKLNHDQALLNSENVSPSSAFYTTISSPITTKTTTPSSSEIDPVIGEAEVEVVDPTKYEEMLSSQLASSTTAHPPALVTLLPVRSNSGIRTRKPVEIKNDQGRTFGSDYIFVGALVTTSINATA